MANTRLSLYNSRDHIRSRLSRAKVVTSPASFAPAEFPRLFYTLEDPDCFNPLLLLQKILLYPSLIWNCSLQSSPLPPVLIVGSKLIFIASACVTLFDCIALYAASSGKYYQGDPASESIKLLTILQM